MKLWAGRFQKDIDGLVNDFNSSIQFDSRLYREDIEGSIAHATMLGKQGIIPMEEADEDRGCAWVRFSPISRRGRWTFTPDNEDIHMNVERILTERIGDAGKRLHTGRSRNDQVALDLQHVPEKPGAGA